MSRERSASPAGFVLAPIATLFAVGGPGAPTLTLNGDTDVDLNVIGVSAADLTWAIADISL